MRRLLSLLALCLAALLAVPTASAQERSAPMPDASAPDAGVRSAPPERAERPVYYMVDAATGRLVLTAEGRAAAEAFRASKPAVERPAPARPSAPAAPLTDEERQILRKEQARALAADPARAARLKQRMADAVAANPRAEVVSFSGNTTDAPFWSRPQTIGDGTSGSCSPAGNQRYQANSFTVPVTGSYDVYASYEGYDGFLTLYEGSFNAADPCLNLIALDDDFGGTSQSLIEGVALTAGVTYFAVVTGIGFFESGPYEGGVYDAGTAPVTFVVTTAADEEDFFSGDGSCNGYISFDCTLRAAIEEANAQPDTRPVFIDFAISFGPAGAEIAPGVWRIRIPESSTSDDVPLPAITQPNVTIDGTTQPGASCGDLVTGPKHDLRVVLDGTFLSSGDGIFGSGGGLTVRGLVVQNFASGSGIAALGDDALIECNYAGTDYTGETAAGNAAGIAVLGGAGAVVQSNVASANAFQGILVFDSLDALVARNLAGSDADGNQPLGNGTAGIGVFGASGATVTTNLASANTSQGIALGSGTTGAVLTNNTLGLTKGRLVAPGMGNGNEGLLIFEGANDNDIGLPGAGNGNFVGSNGLYGVLVFEFGTDDNRIRNNTIGLTRLGDPAPNGYGVYVADFSEGFPFATLIGGLGAGEGNVISGNALSGVYLASGFGTRVEGNTIGLNADGAARPNGAVGDGLDNSGIDVFASVSVDLEIEGNTISGNNGSGVRFFDLPTREVGGGGAGARGGAPPVITDNRIGTTPDGSAARPNVESGLVLTNGANFASVTGNTISGNTDTGVFLAGGVTGVVLENNFIGTNAAGADLGNGIPGNDGLAGVFCSNASGVRIGQNFQPNTIRFNERDGIFVGTACSDISVVGNIIDSNGQLAVDLAPDGPNPNDPGDGDTGANDKLNFPVIVSAENDGTNSIIAWTLSAEPNTTYELLFCRTAVPDPSGFGECPTPNALASTTTDGLGSASGTQTLGAAAYPAGTWVTANATEVDGPIPFGYRATSEFSQSVEVDDTSAPGAITIAATPTSPLVVPRGGQVSFNYTVTNGTANPATGQSWFSAALQNGPTLAEGVITNGTLPAGQSVNVNYTQNVPNNAPIASYDFCLRIGLFPNTVVDEDCFVVTVTPARRAGGAEAWSVASVSPWVPEPIAGAGGAETDEAAPAASEALPTEVALAGAYPNPFGRAATVTFALPEAQRVTLAVYDVLGREVARLVHGEVEAGRHEAVLDGRDLPSGVYLVRLVVGGEVRTERLTLVR